MLQYLLDTVGKMENIKLTITFIFLHVALVKCRIGSGFIKDQRTDFIDFPPKTYKKYDTPVPIGHLRPLGWQRPPESKIAGEPSMLNPEEFFERYVKINKPIVFKSAMTDIPALKKWEKDSYLKDKYGDIDIDVVVKKELFKTGPRKMPFRKFLREYNYEDWYLSNYVPQQMTHELGLPVCLRCGFTRYLMESEIWFSSGDTSSMLHSHADHDLHCLLAGRKDFIFVDPKHKQVFNFKDQVWPGSGYSEMDMDRINMFKHKAVGQVPWSWTTLRPGDCLFIPSGILHQVRSFGRSFSSTYHWAPQPFPLDFSDCVNATLTGFIPLSDAQLLWTYTDGTLQLTNAKLNSESVRHHLAVIMRNATSMTLPLFHDFYSEVMQELEGAPPASDLWKLLDPDGDGVMTRDDLSTHLSTESLSQVARALNFASNERARRARGESATKKDEL